MYKRISGLALKTRIFILMALVLLLAGGSLTAVADTVGPTVTDLTPAPGGTVESLSPQFSLRFNDIDQLNNTAILLQVDGIAVTPVTVTWDGIYQTYYDSCTGQPYTVRTGDDYTKGIISAKMPVLSLGQHTVSYSLKDKAGNTTQQTYNFNVADNSGPQVSECLPANGAVIATGYPVIKTKISDPNGVDPATITLTVDGGPAIVSFDTITSTITYKPSTVLLNGVHQVQVTAKDLLNNTTTVNWSFTVNDTAGPSITGLVPANNGFVYATTPVIEASVSDLSGVVSPAAMKVDGSDYTANWNAGTGKVSLPVTTPFNPGNHTVSMTVYDEQGNVSTANWTFTVDTDSPVVTDLLPAAGPIETLRPVISMRFSDMAQLAANVELKVDGTAVTPKITWDGLYQTQYDSCTGQPYTVRVGDDYTKGMVSGQCPKLSQGAHTISYRLTDKVGNVTQGSYDITISDTAGPVIASSSPAQGAVIATGYPTITATLADANYIVAGSVYMYLQDGLVSTAFDQVTRKISYTVPQPLLNGTYHVDILAQDELGNSSTSTRSFTVSDVTPPAVTNLTPAPNAVILQPQPTIGASISDPSGIANPVNIKVDGASYDVNYNTATGKATLVPPGPLSPGGHTVTLSVYDNQGQQAVSTWSFYLDQVGPEVAVSSPVKDAVILTVSPRVSARFNDVSGVNNTNFRMLLDNIQVNATMEYDGLYQTYYDSCTGQEYTQRVGDDYTKGSIYFQTSKLANNQVHTVQLYVYDKIGNPGYAGWSFTVHDTEAPGVDSMLPAANSVIENSSPTISARVFDNNEIDPQKVFMTINGQQAGTFNPGTAVISHTPVEPLSNGTYTVQVSVYDMYGNERVASWYFTVKHTGAPGINNLIPPEGAGTRSTRPTISARVDDNRGIDAGTVSINVDGVSVPAAFTPETPGTLISGTISGVPVEPLGTGMHTVTLTVRDLDGNIKQSIWAFGVNTFGDMSLNTACTTCHNEGIPAIEQEHLAGADNCALCHQYTVVGSEPDCCYCHDGEHTTSWPPPIGAYQCTQCHNNDLAWVIPTHGSANELNMHNNTAMAEDCKKCHSSYLTREHNLYVEGLGVAYDCNTCHKSTNPAVLQAIANHNRACAACHTQTDHEAMHISNIDQNCLGCHKATLTTDHQVLANLSCDACHQSTDPTVGKAIDFNNKQCTACHASGHNLNLAETVSADIPLYSGVKWSQLLEARIFAGESWMTAEFLDGGRILISGRASLSGPDGWAFYSQQMQARGWILAGVEPASPTDSFTATFTKGTAKAIVWLFAGENHAATPPVDEGSKLEVLYKLK